jgi:hypothetical protein
MMSESVLAVSTTTMRQRGSVTVVVAPKPWRVTDVVDTDLMSAS